MRRPPTKPTNGRRDSTKKDPHKFFLGERKCFDADPGWGLNFSRRFLAEPPVFCKRRLFRLALSPLGSFYIDIFLSIFII